MSVFPIGVSEVDTQTLLQLDDYTLASVCTSNTYLHQLCNNDYFWYQRLIFKGYQQFVTLKDQGVVTTYQDLYIKLVRSAYAVIVVNRAYIYSNINDAYQAFITWIIQGSGVYISDMPPIERANEIGNIMSTKQFPTVELYMLIDGIEIHRGDDRFLLLGVTSDLNYNIGQQIGNIKFTIFPNLNQMPILSKSGVFIFYILDIVGVTLTNTPNTNAILSLNKIGPTEKDNETMSRIVNYEANQRLNQDIIAITKINYNQTQIVFYEGNNQFVIVGTPSFIIDKIQDNFLIAQLPPEVSGNLTYVIKTDVNGNQVPMLDLVPLYNIRDVLPQIYPTLEWGPISNIANYLPNTDFVRTLRENPR